ncbi:GntR family transcriptional regulator [Bordetella sp. N]|uniref:GntR family transcriptional regulator n=1 Tax=Bordetella sp. N TaxID=1746199 RepID=UPI00070FE282|nr:GntR family transcriptional regulator [Bordetella sp. N]ALM85984.1 hypothetical protein ASB57_26250 [Bordetella sp. N]
MLTGKNPPEAMTVDDGGRVADRAYRRLRLAILSGEIKPGTRLVELDLAERLSMSRTPVREAISRLTSDMLVAVLPGGGVEVVDTQHDLDDIFAIREALEGMAARLAAQHIVREELAELDQMLKSSLDLPLDAVRERADLNNRFHRKILQASRSPRLIQMVEDLRDFFIQEEQLRRYTSRDTKTALRHHAEIVDALRHKDGKKAERMVRLHLSHSVEKTKSKKKKKPLFV